MSGGVYETWVTGLRAWGADPTTDLSHLPHLTTESFTPATYQRLLKHLNDAIAGMMASWNAALEHAVSTTRDEHEFARELVELRPLLARRLQLARHPGFPPEISQSLWDGARADILAIQQSIEAGSVTNSERSTTSRADKDRMLALLRNNSFAVILVPDYPIEQLFATRASIASTTVAEPREPSTLPSSRRRIVSD